MVFVSKKFSCQTTGDVRFETRRNTSRFDHPFTCSASFCGRFSLADCGEAELLWIESPDILKVEGIPDDTGASWLNGDYERVPGRFRNETRQISRGSGMQTGGLPLRTSCVFLPVQTSQTPRPTFLTKNIPKNHSARGLQSNWVGLGRSSQGRY